MRSKTSSSREKPLVNRILVKLRERGAFADKIHGGPFQLDSIPDVLACYRGTYVGVEVKRAGGGSGPTRKQLYIIEKIREAGGVAGWVDSVDGALALLEEVDRARDDSGGAPR